MRQDDQQINLHSLAEAFDFQIRKAVSDTFAVPLDDLVLLSHDKKGVYMSEEEPGTLCCFVLGQKNGFLYVVASTIDSDGKNLTSFRAGIVS